MLNIVIYFTLSKCNKQPLNYVVLSLWNHKKSCTSTDFSDCEKNVKNNDMRLLAPLRKVGFPFAVPQYTDFILIKPFIYIIGEVCLQSQIS